MAGGRTGGEQADRRTWSKGEADGRTGGWADRRTARRMEADGRTIRGFKWPRTSFPASLSSAQTTRLTAERVLQGAWECIGVLAGIMSFFFLL